jgi:hypothetical protein
VQKVTATVRCAVPECSWAARHTSTRVEEVVEFLDRVRTAHLATDHPNVIPGPHSAIKPVTVKS